METNSAHHKSATNKKPHIISNGKYFESDNPVRRVNWLSDLFFERETGNYFWSTYPPSGERNYINQEELIKQLWSLWENLSECGQIYIDKNFIESFDILKAMVFRNN